jgi:hypothetical protein
MIRVISILCGFLLAGCAATTGGKVADRMVNSQAIYARAGARFTNAVLFKPAEPAGRDLPFSLAPLIMLEVSETNLPPRLSDGPSGAAGSNTKSGPVVYTWSDSVHLRGQPHGRIAYFWNHAPAVGAKQRANSTQGVRITLGTNGQPMIWEVMADTSGRGLIIVSEELERRAIAEFGPPLAGRRFSVENAANGSPDNLVMRVIDDGPVVMGPIIYLAKDTRDVATIICRCMPAQAANLVGTHNYHLVPHPAPQFSWPWDSLETRLRLPEF